MLPTRGRSAQCQLPAAMCATPEPRYRFDLQSGNVRSTTVVELNVGGQLYTTTVGTLRKYSGSKLADLFSGSGRVCLDAEGRFFIDHSGTYFGPILDYLRTGQVPTQHIPEIYREAQFYKIQPLVKLLEDTPQIFGEQVARKQFLLRVPDYSENLEVLLRLARAEAVAMRCSTVVVCVLRTEEEAAQCAEPLLNLEAQKTPVVKFGPWKVGPGIDDLKYCLEKDIKDRGYTVSCGKYMLKSSWANLNRCFWEFTFTWW